MYFWSRSLYFATIASLLATTTADIRSGNRFCALPLLPSYFDLLNVSHVRKEKKRIDKFARKRAQETDPLKQPENFGFNGDGEVGRDFDWRHCHWDHTRRCFKILVTFAFDLELNQIPITIENIHGFIHTMSNQSVSDFTSPYCCIILLFFCLKLFQILIRLYNFQIYTFLRLFTLFFSFLLFQRRWNSIVFVKM